MGITVTGVPILSAYLPALYAYTASRGLALVAALALKGSSTFHWFAGGIIVFSLLALLAARRSNQNIWKMLELQYQNQDLIAQLSDEIAQRKSAQKTGTAWRGVGKTGRQSHPPAATG